MKHPQKPPKVFSALVIGALGFTLASAYIFVSAAPTKVSQQDLQPSISKIGLTSSDAKGKKTSVSYDWSGKPVAVKYSAAASKLEMFAQATNFSRKAPIWYAFDSFSLVSKVITPAMIEKMALADAPDANSSLWQKTQSATVSNLPLEKDEKRILVVYVSNADPKSVMNKGIVDSLAYIVVQEGTTELQGPAVSINNVGTVPKTDLSVKLAVNSPSGAVSKSGEQVVAKVVVMNSSNPDQQSAQILKIHVTPETNLKQPAGSKRVMKLYRTETLMSFNLLGTYEFDSNKCSLDSGCTAEFDLSTKALQSTIEAGTSQFFTITLSTVDAVTNSELALNIAISHWTDGTIADIAGDVSKLTIKTKKLVY
jgi:hypothetical protein